ncbi:hypothetical protein Tco_1444511 [Tanacetum coccineum]
MSTLTFPDTHNMVAFLEKPTEIKVKTVNGERQLQALVDKKKVIITETSIRSDLKLDDTGGTDCLPTATIFEELARMGAKTTAWNEFSSTMATAIICLATNQKFNLSKYIFDAMSRVLALETTKSNQALEIESLKRRVKSLEKRRKSRTPRFKRLRKVGSASRVESSNDASLGAQEDASKQGRKIADLDADVEVTLVDETQEMDDDNLMFDTCVLEDQEIKFDKVVEELVVNELTLAQTLIEIKIAKPKPITTAATTVTSVRPRAKGIRFHDQEEQLSASTKTFSSSQSQLSQVKDKGKGIMVEPKVPLKKKDQVALDEEMARNLEAQLQAELIKEERLIRQKEEEANIALIESWDNTQAMMEADFELA